MKLEPGEVRDLITYQGGAVPPQAAWIPFTYGRGEGETLMDAVCDVSELYQTLGYGMAKTIHDKVAIRRGAPFVAELYVDSSYRSDGSPIIMRRPDPTPFDVAAERSRRALIEKVVVADTGEQVSMRFDSMCFHSDTPNVIDVAQTARAVVHEFAAAGTSEGEERGRT